MTLVRPYYAYKEDERYILYLDPDVQNRILEEDLTLKGNWNRQMRIGYYYSKEKDASITTAFFGRGIRLYLTGFPNSGKCQIQIDGKPIETIDEYRQQPFSEFQKVYKSLPNGKHTISLKVLNEKNEKSRDSYINVNVLEAIE